MDPLVVPPLLAPRPPRYLPDAAFPSYRFLPGRAPHPTHHPDGHAFGRAVLLEGVLDADGWRGCRTWLRGIDLFNHGFFWESHEAFEALWKARERHDPTRLLLQGLIQTAAAHIHWLLRSARGHSRLRDRAAEKLQRFLASERDAAREFGLDLPPWITATHAFWRAEPRPPETAAHPPLVLQGFEGEDDSPPSGSFV